MWKDQLKTKLAAYGYELRNEDWTSKKVELEGKLEKSGQESSDGREDLYTVKVR